jgi:hypothetical protein
VYFLSVSLQISGPDAAFFNIEGIPSKLITDSSQGLWSAPIKFTPDSTRAYQATLTVMTDVNASFFGAGDTFEFPLTGSGVGVEGPRLAATPTPQTGELRFEWSAAGYLLQRTSNLMDPASWTNVPAGETSPVLLNPGPGAEFFRLVKP